MQLQLDAILEQGRENAEKLDKVLDEQKALTALMRDGVLPSMLTIKELLNNILDALDDEEGGEMQDALEAIQNKLDAIADILKKQPEAVAARVVTAMTGG